MRKSVLALLLACLCTPAFAQQEVQVPDLDQPTGVCQDCPGGEEGGGGGGTPPPPPPPPPPTALNMFEIDPATHTIELSLSNGVVLVIDEPLNKAFISSPQFSYELSLSTVLTHWAGGDAVKAAAMRTKIQAMLAHPKRTAKLVKGAPTQGLMMGMPGGNTFNCYFYYICNVMPSNEWGGGGGGGGGISGPYSFGFWAMQDAGGAGSADRNYWNTRRQDACDKMSSDATQAVVGFAGAAVSCPIAETGIGAIGCYASAITVLDALDNYSKDKALCFSPYPGQGNW